MEKIMKTKNKIYKNICYTTSNIFTAINDKLLTDNKSYTIIVPHVCNNIDVFGAGFAGYIAKYYPIAKENFHLLGNKAVLGYTQFVVANTNKKTNSQLVIANMIAQNETINKGNPRPINYAALVRCMIEIKRFITTDKSDNSICIHAPKFGSGLAGGNWSFIECLIEDIWTNIHTNIHIIK